MLVCSISQLARRAVIAAGLTEAASAQDAPGTGNIVFAALVDDPASVREYVDAYLGQIMVEAANATSVVNAGLAYAARVDEAVAAVDLVTGAVPTTTIATIAEAATAVDQVDGAATTITVTVSEAATASDLVNVSVTTGTTATMAEAATASDLVDASATTTVSFYGVLALNGPIMPATPQPTVIYLEG